MLDVTVRFYVTTGGIAGLAVLLMRISFQVGGFKRAFEEHVKQDDYRFSSHDADIRELRSRRH